MIVGLDLSMTKCGVAILDDSGDLIYSELLKPKASLSHGKKLAYYYHEFNKLITEYEPTDVVIEAGISRFNKSTQAIFRVHGIANMAFRNINQTYVNIMTVKKDFTGNGKADKDAMIREVGRRFGVTVSDDEADAIAVALSIIK